MRPAPSDRRSRGPRAAYWIAARDLLEFARDRRTLVITLLLPMVTYPILALSTTLGLRTAMSEIEARRTGVRLVLVLTGPDAGAFADELGDFIESVPAGRRAETGWPSEVRLEVVSEAEAVAALERGDATHWIAVPGGAAYGLDAFGTVRLEARTAERRPPSPEAAEQFAVLFRDFANAVRSRRILAAGLPPTTLVPIELRMPQPAKTGPALTGSVSGTIAGGVLVLLAVLTMTGAFYPAIDAIAGEKERGTIETLLIVPCSAFELVTGKFLAVFAITVATLLVNLVSIVATFAVAVRMVPRDGSPLLPDHVLTALAVTLVAYLGLAAVAAATCLAVTTASKSGKEAQNTLTPVILLVSALAGSALLPGVASAVLPALAPFAGQVLVAQRAFSPLTEPGEPLLLLLALSVASATVITGLLLWITAVMLTDEDVLFRGQDVAGTGFARPALRSLPTVVQGLVPAVAGLAAIWYLQGFAPADLALAIPLQQACAVVIPLAATAWWQRVDLRRTLALRMPYGGRGLPPLVMLLLGAMLVGYGLFVVGAEVARLRGAELSPAMRSLAERLLALVTSQPVWATWALMAWLPAVCEEALYRGWMLAAFAGDRPSRWRLAAAIVAQAACFAVAHLLPERMPQTFVLGLVNGWLTVAGGSILPAVLCHLVHNSMALVLLAEWPTGGPLVGLACVLAGAGLVAGGSGGRAGWRPGLPVPAGVTSATLAAIGAGLVAAAVARAGAPSAPELQPIFNGRDLGGWRVAGAPCWSVVDGVLVGQSVPERKGSMLYTEAVYGDAVVEAEVRFVGEIDSGIMVRKPELQVQIGVSRSLKRDMTCSFYTGVYPEEARAQDVAEHFRPETWNRVRIEARGDTFTVWLNGRRVSQYTSDRYREAAPIGLQVHAGVAMKVEFRDLRAAALDADGSGARDAP